MPVVGPIHYTNTGHIGVGICGTGITSDARVYNCTSLIIAKSKQLGVLW